MIPSYPRRAGPPRGGGELPSADKRRHKRHALQVAGTIHQDASSFECLIRDISAAGAQVVTARPIAKDRDFILDIDRAGLFAGRLIWRTEERVGMMFLQDPRTVAQRIGAAWGLPS
jgi:hypothetical protein